jgi:hypothetical protein
MFIGCRRLTKPRSGCRRNARRPEFYGPLPANGGQYLGRSLSLPAPGSRVRGLGGGERPLNAVKPPLSQLEAERDPYFGGCP